MLRNPAAARQKSAAQFVSVEAAAPASNPAVMQKKAVTL
jgi:hypothetical protein